MRSGALGLTMTEAARTLAPTANTTAVTASRSF